MLLQIRKLRDEKFHEWRIIPSHLSREYFGKLFKFHTCLNWFQQRHFFFCFFFQTTFLYSVKFLCFKKHILIEKYFFVVFSEKGLNFVYQLFDNIGIFKSWCSVKEEFSSDNISNFKWQRRIYALPSVQKKILKETDYLLQSSTPKSPTN